MERTPAGARTGVVVVHPRVFVAEALAHGLRACGLVAVAMAWDGVSRPVPAVLVVAVDAPAEDLRSVVARHSDSLTRTVLVTASAEPARLGGLGLRTAVLSWAHTVQDLADVLKRPLEAVDAPVPAAQALPHEGLTDREHDVLVLLAQGSTNDGIAASLGISPHTVRTHVGTILSKLGVATRLEAAVVARREGLLPAPTRPASGTR